MNRMLREVKKPFLVSLVLLVVCGLIYPLLLTGISRVVFPVQAGGSLIVSDSAGGSNRAGQVVGSALVGQDFTEPYFMKCRPSAVNYNTFTKEEAASGKYQGVASGSNNYGPTNPELIKRVEKDLEEFLKANPGVKKEDIPPDLLSASGSGLDPHISPEAAAIQIPALALAGGLTEERLKEIVKENTTDRFLGMFGEPTVNVLKVNLRIAEEMSLL